MEEKRAEIAGLEADCFWEFLFFFFFLFIIDFFLTWLNFFLCLRPSDLLSICSILGNMISQELKEISSGLAQTSNETDDQ